MPCVMLITASFFLDGKPVEFVKAYAHLGHVIGHNLDDSDDILYRRGCLIGQINSVLCFLANWIRPLKLVFLKHSAIVYTGVCSGT